MKVNVMVLLFLLPLKGAGCVRDDGRTVPRNSAVDGGTHADGTADDGASVVEEGRDDERDAGGGDNTADSGTTADSPQDTDEPSDGGRAAYVTYDVAYGSDPAQRIDVYVPADAHDAAIVVYVHGGAWAIGNKSNVGAKASLVNELGIVFVSVGYRLSPMPASTDPNRVMHPDHIDDATAAIAYVAEHAIEFGGDAARIGLMGHSAGGHLVALAALESNRAQDLVRCVFANDTEALNIPLALETASAQQTALFENAFGTATAAYTAASPITHVSSLAPPFLLTRRGTADRQEVLESFIAALTNAGVSHTVIDARGLSHEEVNAHIGQADDDVMTPEVVAFFSDCLQ